MSQHRSERVAEAIRAVIAEMLLRDIKDPRVGLVTLTAVDVSPDLRQAKVYFSCIGDAAARQRCLEGLRSAARFMKGQLLRRLELRYAPDLTFVFDASLEHAERLATLLRQAGTPDPEKS